VQQVVCKPKVTRALNERVDNQYGAFFLPLLMGCLQGDRVVVSYNLACSHCPACKRGLYSSCDTTNPSGDMEALYGHKTGTGGSGDSDCACCETEERHGGDTVCLAAFETKFAIQAPAPDKPLTAACCTGRH
jgi:hypothetical protein